MDQSFWHSRWENSEIAFHEGTPNHFLETCLPGLDLPPSRIFVPLCGKAYDMVWLAQAGHTVIGAEFEEIAVREFFGAVAPEKKLEELGRGGRYEWGPFTIFNGDLFGLTAADLGAIDFVYDRGALVALPEEMRPKYAAHLTQITGAAPQLLVSYDFNSDPDAGPPHGVFADEIADHYSDAFYVVELGRRPLTGPLALRRPTGGDEVAWLLSPH